MATTASAQVTLGYCGEEVSTGSLANSKADVALSCAAGLTPELQGQYADLCAVTYLHVGLLDPGQLTSFSVWARRSLSDSVDLARVEVDPATLVEGWNDIALPDTLALSRDSMLYLGFDYTQSRKTLMASSGTKAPEAAWMAVNGKWKDYSANTRPLCIAAGLCPLHHTVVSLGDVRLDRRSQLSGDEPITVTGEFLTLGARPVTTFRVGCADGRNPSVLYDYECPHPVPFGQRASFSLTVEPSGWRYESERHDVPLALRLLMPDSLGQYCAALPDTSGVIYLRASDTLYYEVGSLAPDEVRRNLLVEHFTSEGCGFAPIGMRRLYDLERQADAGLSRLIVLSHHEGFGPADPWRVSEGSDYRASLFGPRELAFAPALLFGRVGTPVSATLPVDTLLQCLRESQAVSSPLFSFGEPTYGYDAATQRLSVSLPVHLWSAGALSDPRVVVCLVQDEVASVGQKNYYPERYLDDTQRHVVRRYLLPAVGQGQLFPGADMEAVTSGRARLSDLFPAAAEGAVATQTLQFYALSSSDPLTLPGLRLVAYIYDRSGDGRICGVEEWLVK